MDGATARVDVPKRVQEVFDRDGVVNEAVSRGIVNYRALARWILHVGEFQATEDAVLSAIRRVRRRDAPLPFDAAHGVIAASHLNVRSGVCQVKAPRAKQVQEKLSAIFREIDFEKGEILYYTQGEGGIKILVDESNLKLVQSHLGQYLLRATKQLSAVSLVQPEAGLDTPGILALLSNTLTLQGINIVDAVFGLPEYIFFVRQEDTLRAYQALETLISVSKQRQSRPVARVAARRRRAATPSA